MIYFFTFVEEVLVSSLSRLQNALMKLAVRYWDPYTTTDNMSLIKINLPNLYFLLH